MAVARGLTVVDEFADAVESGKDEDRPAWLRMISELNAPGRTWGQAAGGEPVDGRKTAGMERRASTLAAQIVRTIDLAAQIADPKPVLRRVADLALQRAELQAGQQVLQDRRQ